MKSLSVRQPWADEIVEGTKKTEYRTWKTKYRGPLLIVSSKYKCPGHLLGHALGVVELRSITGFDGDYRWHLANPRKIEPFEVKGKLNLYETPDELIKYLK